MKLRERFDPVSERLLLKLARANTLLPLALIGLITGIASGGVIVAFRLIVENSQLAILPGDHPEAYEALDPWLRLLLPIVAGLLIGLLFQRAAGGDYVLGVARVMERLAYHQGYLHARGFFLQFFGAAIAIIGGHSVGREGPNIYLGAAAGSLLGQYFQLPNNSIRTMVGCGVAAGIAASFNTPLAGVIFALEVVMLDYTLASFTPVILAAVSANALSISVFGRAPAFDVPAMIPGSLLEAPLVMLLALVCGTLAAAFIDLLQRFSRWSAAWPFWSKATLAGVIVGVIGVAAPASMGIGYDTVSAALHGDLALPLLALAIFAKLLASAACLGLGIPGGMIGPALFIGACTGSLFGLIGNQLFPDTVSSVAFYTLLGMGALMGASLQAPLSALTAIVELTHNPAVVMPGMFVIVIAGLTASELFGKESIFISLLKAKGLDYRDSPVMQSLRRAGVAASMSDSFRRADAVISRDVARKLLESHPEWIVFGERSAMTLMPSLDLLRHLEERELAAGDDAAPSSIDLRAIPARRMELGAIHLQATLQQAKERLDQGDAEALYVERMNAPGIHRIYGILTREMIESSYSA